LTCFHQIAGYRPNSESKSCFNSQRRVLQTATRASFEKKTLLLNQAQFFLFFQLAFFVKKRPPTPPKCELLSFNCSYGTSRRKNTNLAGSGFPIFLQQRRVSIYLSKEGTQKRRQQNFKRIGARQNCGRRWGFSKRESPKRRDVIPGKQKHREEANRAPRPRGRIASQKARKSPGQLHPGGPSGGANHISGVVITVGFATSNSKRDVWDRALLGRIPKKAASHRTSCFQADEGNGHFGAPLFLSPISVFGGMGTAILRFSMWVGKFRGSIIPFSFVLFRPAPKAAAKKTEKKKGNRKQKRVTIQRGRQKFSLFGGAGPPKKKRGFSSGVFLGDALRATGVCVIRAHPLDLATRPTPRPFFKKCQLLRVRRGMPLWPKLGPDRGWNNARHL